MSLKTLPLMNTSAVSPVIFLRQLRPASTPYITQHYCIARAGLNSYCLAQSRGRDARVHARRSLDCGRSHGWRIGGIRNGKRVVIAAIQNHDFPAWLQQCRVERAPNRATWIIVRARVLVGSLFLGGHERPI